MLDTIKLRVHAINDQKKSTADIIKQANSPNKAQKYKPVYVSTANNELYRKMLGFRGINASMCLMYNRELNTWETTTEEEFITSTNSKKIAQHHQVRQKMKFVEEGVQKDINMKIRGKYRITSSSPDIVYHINENGGYIDFEFSIPKYLYGHNLAEFLPQGGSKLFLKDPISLLSFAGQKKYLHQRTLYLIDKFANDLQRFYKCEESIDLNYLEIRRVDLCFNQKFDSKDDAMRVIDAQKKIMMKRQRKNANISRTYDTSISYVGTAGSYFKIYHKGTEYSRVGGDLKKHIEINASYIDQMMSDHEGRHAENYAKHSKEIWGAIGASGKDVVFHWDENVKDKIKDTVNEIYKAIPYKVDFLKAEMDKVLRYEVSLTGKFFASQYKRYHFRVNEKICPWHNKQFQMYLETKNMMDTRTAESEAITPFGRSNYKMYHDWLNRGISLVVMHPDKRKNLQTFETREKYDIHPTSGKYQISRFEYSHSILSTKDVGLFSEGMLNICFDHFVRLIRDFQVKKIRPFDEILDKIKEYNRQVDVSKAEYNKRNHMKIKEMVFNHERKVNVWQNKRLPNGGECKHATQLLTQTQLRNNKFKKVNETLLTTFLKAMEWENLSLDQVFTELKTPKSKQYRIKKDLEMFGVFRQNLVMEKAVFMPLDFSKYYANTQQLKYRQKFFPDYHLNYKQAQFKFEIKK